MILYFDFSKITEQLSIIKILVCKLELFQNDNI